MTKASRGLDPDKTKTKTKVKANAGLDRVKTRTRPMLVGHCIMHHSLLSLLSLALLPKLWNS